MDEKHHAFEQVESDRELLKEDVEKFKDGCTEWEIEFDDGTPTRRTTIAGIAYYAYHFDDNATVTALGE